MEDFELGTLGLGDLHLGTWGLGLGDLGTWGLGTWGLGDLGVLGFQFPLKKVFCLGKTNNLGNNTFSWQIIERPLWRNGNLGHGDLGTWRTLAWGLQAW